MDPSMMAPPPPPPPPGSEGHQGPQTKEQFAAVAKLLQDSGRSDEIVTMLSAPQDYADELAQVQKKDEPSALPDAPTQPPPPQEEAPPGDTMPVPNPADNVQPLSHVAAGMPMGLFQGPAQTPKPAAPTPAPNTGLFQSLQPQTPAAKPEAPDFNAIHHEFSQQFGNGQAAYNPASHTQGNYDQLAKSMGISSQQVQQGLGDYYNNKGYGGGQQQGIVPQGIAQNVKTEDQAHMMADPNMVNHFTSSETNETGPDWLRDEIRTAGAHFTPMEQRELIDEQGEARNSDKLDLSNTHYIEDDFDAAIFM